MRCQNNCPTLQPSEQEFRNFAEYTEKITKQYSKLYGMVKVVPPKSWKSRQSPYQDAIKNFIIQNPIEQNPQGKAGIFEFKHIPIRSISYQEYKKKYQNLQTVLNKKSSEQIQTLFWQTLPYSPPVYGADLMGSLMENCAGQWNLDRLNSLLNHGLQKNIKGVNMSYCYFGSWKALFCWHKQDLDLQAINYLHFGKSKFWYCIQADDSQILQKECKKHFFKGFDRCSQYLRHKTCLMNPYSLKKDHPRLKITKIQQKAGQFIIGFSGAYHCGFNFGVNVAQAVNFGTLGWLSKLRNVNYCRCKKSSVRINYQAILERLLQTEHYKNNPFIVSLKNELQKEIITELQSKDLNLQEKEFQEQQEQNIKGKKVKKTKKIQKKKKIKYQQSNIKLKKEEEIQIKRSQNNGIEQQHLVDVGGIPIYEQNQIMKPEVWMSMIQQQQSPVNPLMSNQ